MAYTNLEEVKRVLRSSNKEVVRFSDSLVEIIIDKNDQTTGAFGFRESEISVDADFDNKLTLKLKFTSPTTYDVFEITEKLKYEKLLDENISISNIYVTPDGTITIQPTAFFANIEAKDMVTIGFDPHISDNDALKYIEDTEVEIDSMLTASGMEGYEEGEQRLFDPLATPARPIPPQISVAATYLAAYYIFTDIFVQVYKEGALESSYSTRWKRRAEKYIESYIKTKGLVTPRAKAFPLFIDKIGVPDVGPGMSKMVEDETDFNRDAETESIFDTEGHFYHH